MNPAASAAVHDTPRRERYSTNILPIDRQKYQNKFSELKQISMLEAATATSYSVDGGKVP